MKFGPLIKPISPRAMALAAKGVQKEIDKLLRLVAKLEGRG